MNSRRLGAGAAIVLLLGLPQEAFLSQIVFTDISLQELGASARFIVQAIYREKVEKEKGGGFAFDVTGSWTPLADESVTGDRIRVWQSGAEALGTAARFAKHGGARRSPLVNALRPAPALTPGASYVLFLHKGVHAGEYVLEAQDGFVTPAEFEKIRNDLPKLSWLGLAAHAKAGAVLQVEAFGPVYLDGLDYWPKEIVGKMISATGLLVHKKTIPDPVQGGTIAPGSEGLQWVLEKSSWSLDPADFSGIRKPQ